MRYDHVVQLIPERMFFGKGIIPLSLALEFMRDIVHCFVKILGNPSDADPLRGI